MRISLTQHCWPQNLWTNILHHSFILFLLQLRTIHAILLRTVDDYYHTLTPPEMTRLHKSWRFTRSCSASLPAATLEKLEKLFGKPWLEAYAMTEASHQMTANPLPNNGPHKPGSVGRPTNVTVILLDDNDEELTEPGAVGEVSIRAPNVMHGYLVPKTANATAFSWVNSRGAYFFRTGDQARFDEDGFLFLTGRLKEIINRGGEKIAPLEIDNILTQHPNVNTAVAFGVPDEIYGENVNAAVILKDASVGTSAAELITFCKERLSGFKVPARVFITDDVPRTATGKIQRRIVSAHFQKKLSAKL